MVLVLFLLHGSIRGAGQKIAALETRKVFGPAKKDYFGKTLLTFQCYHGSERNRYVSLKCLTVRPY